MPSNKRKQQQRLSWRRKLFRIGLVVGLIGAILAFFLPTIYTSGIRSQLKLTRDGEIFKNWLKFPVPLTTKFHFFHVLNPEEAMNGAKVKVREVGPFTMEQWRHKEVVDWGPNDETVIYNEFKKYIFKPELSDDWDQEITTINPIVAGLAANLEETMKTVPLVNKLVSPFLYSIVSGALIAHGHNLFLKTTPKQLLQGHHINLFANAAEMVKPFSVFGLKEEDLLPTAELPNNAFGILNGKNNTAMGPFEVNTGIVDQSKYSYIVSYKGQKRMHKWGSDHCNKIIGTDGAQFPPFRNKRDRLPIFTADICRTLYVIFDRDDEFKGIPVWRLKLDPKLFETPAMNPDNECYCAHWRKRPDRCSVRGTLDLAGCLNAPLILSMPHFMGTEPNLGNLIEGMEPDKKKHEFLMYFEPRVAMPVYAFARLQMSIRVERTAFLRGFDKIRNAYIPLVWIEESGGVDDFLAMVLKIILVWIIDGSVTFAWFMMIVGWLTAIICFLYGVFWTGARLESEERLYSIDSKDQSKAQLANAAADDESDDESDIDDESGDSNTSEHSALNKKIDLNLRASAPSLEKSHPSSPTQVLKHTYVPVYRKTTTTIVQSHQQQQQQHHHHHQATRSSSYKNVRNFSSTSPSVVYRPTSTTSPISTTTTRPLSAASAKSLPRIRDLDEIRSSVVVPLVDKNAL